MNEYDRFNRSKFPLVGTSLPLILILLLWVATSCKEKERHQDILSPAAMVKVLGELYITEEKINKLGIDRDSSAKAFDYLDDKVFEKYATTDTLFKRSLNYYLERPEEIEKIYATLIDSLNLREQRMSIPDL
jgi:hypothetical protein